MKRLRVLLLVPALLAGCALPFDSKGTLTGERAGAAEQAKPASELLDRMLDLSDETTRVHGGEWTYGDPERSPWDKRTAGYFGTVCPGSDPLSYRYGNMIMGPAVDDPEAAVSKYVSHFEKQGFTEVGRFNEDVPSDIGSGYYIIVTLEDAEGNALIYQAGNHLSSLSYEGPCSEDPNMRVPTT